MTANAGVTGRIVERSGQPGPVDALVKATASRIPTTSYGFANSFLLRGRSKHHTTNLHQRMTPTRHSTHQLDLRPLRRPSTTNLAGDYPGSLLKTKTLSAAHF